MMMTSWSGIFTHFVLAEVQEYVGRLNNAYFTASCIV